MNAETELENSQKSSQDKMESDIIQGFIIEPPAQVSSEEATIQGSSCSSTSDKNYLKNWDIKRHPLVLLTKLDPGITTLTVKSGWDSFTKLNKSSDGAASCSNSKDTDEKNWYDMEGSLSDISVSDIDISDSEDLAKTMTSKKVERERSRSRASKETHSDVRKKEKMEKKSDVTATGKKSDKETKEKKTAGKQRHTSEKKEEHEKSDVSKKSSTKTETNHSRRYSKESSKEKEELSSVDSRRRSRTSTHSRNKHVNSSDSSKSDKIKKSKEDTLEQVMPKPSLGKDEKVKKIKSNIRYELCISPITLSDLKNDTFRKFINLAADCSVYFNKRRNPVNPVASNGAVVLYFGDAPSLQSALQRLSQLPTLADGVWVKATIKCFEIQPPLKKESKEKWRTVLAAKLTFQFNTDKADKLRQLFSYKDRKREGTKKACAQLHRVPSSMTQEMLSLLFPFSLSVQISNTDTQQKGISGPISVEFESQEWMEAVLTCFQDFIYISLMGHVKPFYLRITNFTPPPREAIRARPSAWDKSEVDAKQQNSGHKLQRPVSHDRSYPGPGKSGLDTRHEQQQIMRNRNEEVKRYDNRKRTLLESRSRGRSPEKRPRLAHLDQTRGLNDQNIGSVQKMEQPQLLNSSKDALRMLAISRGLDPNNQDVIKILEMTTQLEALQALTIKQRMEAQSLVIIGQAQDQLMQQRRESERQAQEQLMQQRRESERQAQEQLMQKRRESERQAQEQLMQKRRESERHKASSHMFGQKGRWAEEESRKKRDEAEQKLKENISHKFQLLEDLKSRMHKSEQSYRNSPKSVSTHTFGNEANIKPYRNAPPTIGLLGTGPLNVPSAPQSAAYPSQKDGKIKDSLFAFAGYQPGKDLSREKNKHSSRSRSPREANKSRALRLNSSLERDGRSKNSYDRADHHSNDRHSNKQRSSSRQKSDNIHYGGRDNLDPSHNDTPLDFHKRSSFMSTEQAVKQDFDRTVQALREVKSTIPKREEKRTGAVEELYLPVQFGKNAVKKTPWEMEEEKRKALDRKRNYPDVSRDNNDRKHANSKPGFRDTGYPRSNPGGENRKDWAVGKGLLGSGPGDKSYDINKPRGAPVNRFQGKAPETDGLLGSAPSEPPVRATHGILKKNSVVGAVEKYDNVNREISRDAQRNTRTNTTVTGMHRGRGNLRGGVGHTPFPANNRGVNNPRVFNQETKEEHEWGDTEHHDWAVPPNSNRGNFKAGQPFRNPQRESFPGWKDLKPDYKPDYPSSDWNQEWSASGAEPYYGAGQDPPDTYNQEPFYPPEEPYVEEFGGPIEEHHAPEYPEIPVETRAPLPLDNAGHYGEIGEGAWRGTYDHHPERPLPVNEESAGPAEAPLEYEGYGYSGESTEYPTEQGYYEGHEEYYDDNQFEGTEYAPAFRGHPTLGRIGLNRGRTRPFRGRGESIRGHNSYRGRVAEGPAVPEQQYGENVDMDWSSYPSDPAPNFSGEESAGQWGYPAGRGTVKGRGAFKTGSLLPTPHERENTYMANTNQQVPQTQGWGGGQRSQFPPPYTNRGRGNAYF